MPEYCVAQRILRFDHMIAVLKSDFILVSRESDVIGYYNNKFLCSPYCEIHAEACTT